MFLHADSEDSDQTGCRGHFVGFVVRWLKCRMRILTTKIRAMFRIFGLLEDRFFTEIHYLQCLKQLDPCHAKFPGCISISTT